jgi:O-antigen ligase
MTWVLVQFDSLLTRRIRSKLIQAVIIVGLWGISLFAGRLIGKMFVIKKPELLIAAALAPIALLVLYRLGRFEYGLLAVLLTAGLVRVRLPTGTQSEIVISLLVSMGLVGVWLFQMLVVDKKLLLKPSLINRPVLAFISVVIVSYVWSNLFRDPLVQSWGSFPLVQLAALIVMILLPGVALLVSNKVEGVKWLKWMAWIFIVLGVLSIVAYNLGLPFKRIFNTDGIFPTWLAALAYGLALFDEDLPLWVRGLLLGLLASWIYWTFIKGLLWLSGWVPLGMACAVITFKRSRKLFSMAVIGGLIFLGLNFNYYYQRIYLDSRAEGDLERLELWRTNVDHVSKHPLFGSGPAGYAIYYMTYHPENARSTHNNFFDVLAQTGIVGFSILLWMLVTFLRTGNKTTRKLHGRRDFEEAFANATLGGCVGAIFSMMLGDWVLPFAYNQTIVGFDHSVYTWLFLGGMVSLYRITHVDKPAGET